MIVNTCDHVTVTTPRPPFAILERVGQMTHVWPPLEALTRALRTTTYLPDPRRGGRLVLVTEPLFREIGDPHYGPGLAVPAGLEAVLRRLFEREGYAALEAGDRRTALPEPDLAAAARVGPPDAAVLDLIRRGDRGLIAYDGDPVEPPLLVAQAALAFPDASFAVVASRRRDVAGLAARLRRHVPGVRWVTGGSPLGRVGRVVVATRLALGAAPVGLWERQVVVCMDAAEAVGAASLFALQHAPRARLFALRDGARALAPHDRDGVAALFGFEEVIVPRHGGCERPVEVAYSGPRELDHRLSYTGGPEEGK